MPFSRNWSIADPVDHLKFNEISGKVRHVREDIAERLSEILSGFSTGDLTTTPYGIKLGKFLTVGTGTPTAPSGTGAAVDFNIYLKQVGSNTYGDLYFRNNTGSEARFTIIDKLCLDNARLSNNTWIVGTDTAGAAQNILKVNTNNAVEFASHIIAPDTAPTTALQLTPKGYVDNKFPINLTTGNGTAYTGVLPAVNGGLAGKKIDYGTVSFTANETKTVNLAVTFSNTNYIVVMTPLIDATNDYYVANVRTKAVASFTVFNYYNQTITYMWIAIGT